MNNSRRTFLRSISMLSATTVLPKPVVKQIHWKQMERKKYQHRSRANLRRMGLQIADVWKCRPAW